MKSRYREVAVGASIQSVVVGKQELSPWGCQGAGNHVRAPLEGAILKDKEKTDT